MLFCSKIFQNDAAMLNFARPTLPCLILTYQHLRLPQSAPHLPSGLETKHQCHIHPSQQPFLLTSGGPSVPYLHSQGLRYRHACGTDLFLPWPHPKYAQQERVSQLWDSNVNPDAIVICPNGYEYAKNKREWSGDPDTPSNINDTVFVRELLDHVQDRY